MKPEEVQEIALAIHRLTLVTVTQGVPGVVLLGLSQVALCAGVALWFLAR